MPYEFTRDNGSVILIISLAILKSLQLYLHLSENNYKNRAGSQISANTARLVIHAPKAIVMDTIRQLRIQLQSWAIS